MTGGLDNRRSDADAGPAPDIATGRPSPTGPSTAGYLGFVACLGLTLTVMALFGPTPVRAAGAQAASGGELYLQHCSSCHQATGLGIEGTFPPLLGNPAAVDGDYVRSVIVSGQSGPIEVLGVSYDGVMPAAAGVSDDEIDQIVQYVVGLATPATDEPTEPEPTPDEVAGPVTGDADRGNDLFTGRTRFDNGGGACVGCHTAGSVGNLGGWSLGPDLSEAFQQLGGEAGLNGWLANPPSATMRPIFDDRPLTEAEVADITAFLGDAAGQDQPSSSVDRLTVAGLVGLSVLLIGMAVAWRGMRRTYVEVLRDRSTPSRRQPGRRGIRPQTPTPTGAGRGERIPTPLRRSR